MFAKPTNVGILQRVVATLVACAVVLWSIGAYATAQAANLNSISDTLTDSDPSVTSAHTIAFTIPTGSSLGIGNVVSITFPADFTDVATTLSGDLTVTVDGGAPVAIGSFDSTGQVISFDNVAAAAGQEVVVAIADGKIVNPATPGSYEIVVDTGAAGDVGKTRVSIIDNVLVTAVVETTFDFTITGLATSTPVNGTSTTGSTTATEIPFGVLSHWEVKTLAQQLNVTTNAANGFVVTVEQDGNLQSSTGADIDGFIDGAYTNTPVVWQSPANTLGTEDTYGHWGITSEDDLNADEFSGTKFVAASTTPREVFSHNSVSDGSAADIGQTIVGFQVEISPLQEAADDYNTTLTYIATPTF